MAKGLTETMIKVIGEWFEGKDSAQVIAERNGYKSRQSVYDIVNSKEGKKQLEKLQKAVLKSTYSKVINQSNEALERIIKIGKGDVDPELKTIASTMLKANQFILEVAGLYKNSDIVESLNDAESVDKKKDNIIEEFEKFRKMKEQEKEAS